MTPRTNPSQPARPSPWRPLWRLFAQTSGRRLALGALLATATVLAGMGLLGLSGWFITATALAGAATAGAVAFDVFMPSAGIRLLALGRTAGRYAERLVTHDATLAVLAALRERLFRGWAGPQAARALLRQPARLLFRLTHDIDALESLYLRLGVPAAAALGATALAGVLLGRLDGRLGMALVAWLLLAGAGIAWLLARSARRPALRRALHLERLRAQAIDLVAGQTDLAMAGQLPAQGRRLARSEARLAQADDALHRLDTAAGAGHALAGSAALAGVLLAVGALADRQTLPAPLAALSLLVALSALEPFAALRRGALEAARCALAARRLAPRFDAPDDDATGRDAATGAAPPQPETALHLQGVTLQHPGRARPALCNIHLHIGVGERVALIGASGAGKSSLLAVAAGEWPLPPARRWAQAATWLTQHTELFQDSLRDNLRLARPQASDDQLWAALQASGLAADAAALPQGLDTVLGEGGLGLSGGQARRLALARLLLHPARLWLLDEPTEGLDAATAADVLARLAGQADLPGADGRPRTLLIATHWRREAALADRLLWLSDGRLQADLRRGEPGFEAAIQSLRQG